MPITVSGDAFEESNACKLNCKIILSAGEINAHLRDRLTEIALYRKEFPLGTTKLVLNVSHEVSAGC